MFISVQIGTFVSHDKEFCYKTRGFSSPEEMNKAIIERHNSVVKSEDTVYALGDCIMGADYTDHLDLIKQMNGIKFLAIGNHDSDAKIAAYTAANLFQDIQFGYRFRYKKIEFWLSHYPMNVANKEDPKPVWNIHGHDHDCCAFHGNSHNYDVCMDAHNCYPVSIDTIVEEIKAHH